MGNCIALESGLEWGGEDWSLALTPPAPADENGVVLGDCGKGGVFTASSDVGSKAKTVSCTEVKVKITKKQLEELIGKLDVQGVTVQQVLTQLMKVSATYEAHRRTSKSSSTPTWRPRLHSIPEICSADS